VAIKTWVGKQRKRAQVTTLTIASFANGETFITTVGVKAPTYIATTALDTSAAVLTANLIVFLQALTDPEFTELTFAAGSTTTTITVTGPTDGKPFTLTATGTGTYSAALTYAALSPNDWTDPLNWDTGTIPTTGDTAVIGNTAIDILYNIDDNGVDVYIVRRENTHTGRIGLPDTSIAGYPEYRPTHLEVAAVTVVVETSRTDAAGSLRFKSTGAASTWTIQGDGTATLDAEPVELYGTAATSVIRCIGSGIALAPLDSQAGAVTTLTGESSAVRVGAGLTLVNATMKGCSWRIEASCTTLTQTDGGSGEVGRAAAVGNSGLKLYSGYVTWTSTGATGNSPVLGPGATLDFTAAPGSVVVGGTVSAGADSAWIDPRNVCGAYAFNAFNCRLQDLAFNPGTNRTLTVS